MYCNRSCKSQTNRQQIISCDGNLNSVPRDLCESLMRHMIIDDCSSSLSMSKHWSNVGVHSINEKHLFFAKGYKLTCLLYCMIPMHGKTHVKAAGRISESANSIHCWTYATSVGDVPRRASLAKWYAIALLVYSNTPFCPSYAGTFNHAHKHYRNNNIL